MTSSPLKEAIAKAIEDALDDGIRANRLDVAEYQNDRLCDAITEAVLAVLDASGDTRYVAITREQRAVVEDILPDLFDVDRGLLGAIVAAYDCAGAPDAPSEP